MEISYSGKWIVVSLTLRGAIFGTGVYFNHRHLKIYFKVSMILTHLAGVDGRKKEQCLIGVVIVFLSSILG